MITIAEYTKILNIHKFTKSIYIDSKGQFEQTSFNNCECSLIYSLIHHLPANDSSVKIDPTVPEITRNEQTDKTLLKCILDEVQYIILSYSIHI